MSQFILKRGNLSALNNLPVQDGQFIVVKDERAIYVDTAAGRIRMGDFQEFASVAALNANVNPSTSALYYIADINVLAKWVVNSELPAGGEYVQINTDTGATSVEVVGDGNAVTAAEYSAKDRKLILTKGATYALDSALTAEVTRATGVEEGLANRVGSLEETVDGIVSVGGEANVIETVKVNGEALEVSEKAVNIVLGALANKDIVSKDDLSDEVKASLAKADSALQEHQSLAEYRKAADQDVIDTGLSNRIKALEDADVQDALTAEQLAAVNSGITAEKVAAYDAYATGKENVGVAAGLVEAAKTELQGKIDAVSAVADAAQTAQEVSDAIDAEITALDLANTYEPIGAENRAKSYTDSQLEAANLGQYTTEQEVKDIVDAVVAGAVEGDTITGLSNLVEYLNTHGAEAKDMASAIDVLEGKVETIEGKPAYSILSTDIAAWNNEIGAKELAASKTTTAEVKTQIEAYGYATEADLTLAEGRISALEAVKDDYKAYADQAEADAISAAASDAASKYETIGTAQGIVDALDLSNTYEAKGEAAKVQSSLNDYVASNDKALADVKATAEAAYVKPEAGIAKSDLAADVQASLGKADTAIQEHQDISHLAVASTVYTKEETNKAIADAALVWEDFQ